MFWRKKQERDLDRELQAHLDLETEEHGGDTYAARRALGNRTLIQEATRSAWGWSALDQFRRDLSQGARMLWRRPVFTAIAVLSLAIGIGANAAIFSFLNTILIRTLDAPGADRLVLLRQHNEAFHIENCCFPYQFFERLRAQDTDFEALAVTRGQQVSLALEGSPVRSLPAEFVAGEYFDLMGGRPAQGRLLTEADNQAENPVAVISYKLWQDVFGNRSDIVGQRIRVNGQALTVVGVTHQEYTGSSLFNAIDLQIPFSMLTKLTGPGRTVQIFARLRPEASRELASQQLEALGKQLKGTTSPKPDPLDKVYFIDGSQGLNSRKDQFGRPAMVLMLLVGTVLLITCANLAALLVVRSVERSKEAGMRVALGASRWALFRGFLTESALLALAGGAMGVGVAWALIRFLSNFLIAEQPGLIALVKLDGDVLAFSLAATAVSALLFGLLPAWRASKADPLPALQGADGTPGRRPVVSRVILATQVALSLALLFAAGLFTRTLVNLKSVELGFQAENLIVFGPRLTGTIHEGAGSGLFFQELLRQAAALPGVQSAGLGQIHPLSGSMAATSLTIPGVAAPQGSFLTASMNFADRGYFQTFGVPLLEGEHFPETVPASGIRPVIVDRELERQYLGGNALGKQFKFGNGIEARVIGVVGSAKYRFMRETPQPTLYLPFTGTDAPAYLAVRTTNNPQQVMEQLRAMLARVDSTVTVAFVKTMEQQIDEALARERLLAFLANLLGGFAVLLSAIGLYGVLAFSVVRRTREIGIRMAIGATRPEIIGLLLKEGAWPVIGGVIVGVPLALAGGRLTTALLFGLDAQDPSTALGATGVLLTAALAAAMIPAWRASRLDPTTTLRQD